MLTEKNLYTCPKETIFFSNEKMFTAASSFLDTVMHALCCTQCN